MNSVACPACGETSLVPGTMQSTGTLHFRPCGVKFMTFHTADISIAASMCRQCGFIVMRGDLEKLHLVQSIPGSEELVGRAANPDR